ncbi:hypothetical protein [Amycolatopsis taiwanensis]|nr:hypothetical protein [Amycolatopsis taiwanensis]
MSTRRDWLDAMADPRAAERAAEKTARREQGETTTTNPPAMGEEASN